MLGIICRRRAIQSTLIVKRSSWPLKPRHSSAALSGFSASVQKQRVSGHDPNPIVLSNFKHLCSLWPYISLSTANTCIHFINVPHTILDVSSTPSSTLSISQTLTTISLCFCALQCLNGTPWIWCPFYQIQTGSNSYPTPSLCKGRHVVLLRMSILHYAYSTSNYFLLPRHVHSYRDSNHLVSSLKLRFILFISIYSFDNYLPLRYNFFFRI